MASLGSLVVWLEANITKYEEGMSKSAYIAEKEARRVQNAVDKMASNIKKTFATIGVGLGLNELWGTFKEVAKYESNLLKLANRLNSTTEELSAMGIMARKTGMDQEDFFKVIEKWDKTISSAALKAHAFAGAVDEEGQPLEKSSRLLDELGLRAEKLQKLPLPERMKALSEAFLSNIAPGDQLRVALEGGGKSGAAFVIALKAGPQAMEDWAAKADRLGMVIGTDMAQRMSKANEAIGDLKASWHSFAYTLTDTAAPAITTVLNGLTQMINAARNAEGLFVIFSPEKAYKKWKGLGKDLFGPESFRGHGATGDWLPEEVFKPPVRPGPKLGGAKAAKELAFTEVTPFEQAMWGVEDAERLFKEAEELLGRLVSDQERLVKGQQSYASEMASLSPLLADQIRYKEEALLLEDKAARLALDRERDEKKIGEAVYAQEIHFRDLLTQAKKLSLERERWAGQGWAGGLKMGAWELAKGSEDWQAREMAAWVKGFPKEASSFLARNFIEGIKTGQMDLQETFINLGYSTAEAMIQKFLENWLNQVVPLVSNTFANIFSGGGAGGGGFWSFLSGIFGGGSSPVSAKYWHQGSGGPIAAAVYGHQGLAPNEYLAVLLGSERVLSPQETAAYDAGMRRGGGGGGAVTVKYEPKIIINNNHSGAQVKTEQQGNGDLIVTIDEMLAAAAQYPGKFQKVLTHNRKMTR
jgi:hypothetical protein